MALPSQTERQSEIGRSYVYKKGQPRSRHMLIILASVGLLAAGGAVYGLVKLSGGSNRTASAETPPGGTAPSSAKPVEPTTAKSTPLPPTPTSTSTPTSTANPQNSLGAGGASVPPPVTIPQTGSLSPQVGADAPQSGGGTVPGTNPASSTAPPATKTTSATDSGKPVPVDVSNPSLQPAPPAPATPPGGTGTPTGAGQPVANPLAASGSTAEVRQLIEQADARQRANDLIESRRLLSRALASGAASSADADTIRQRLATLNEDLVFSPKVHAGDPLAEEYTIRSGDRLITIARDRTLATDWRLIQRVNRLSDPGKLRVGQKLKLVRGPFHAIVDKSDYRLDLFQGSPDEPDRWIYIRSFKVGLGTGNSTPLGDFVIRRGSKLVDPHWVNPQTGEKFDAKDPKNPIGEYWLGLQGVGKSAAVEGYGLHGTIEPQSIGAQKSMGCVRLADEDIKLLYELLVEQISTVKIRD